jgi:hypothetical protein
MSMALFEQLKREEIENSRSPFGRFHKPVKWFLSTEIAGHVLVVVDPQERINFAFENHKEKDDSETEAIIE